MMKHRATATNPSKVGKFYAKLGLSGFRFTTKYFPYLGKSVHCTHIQPLFLYLHFQNKICFSFNKCLAK